MGAIGLDSMDDGFLAFCWRNLHPRDRAKMLASAKRTLWVFGAGASHHYGLNRYGVQLPLATGFFEAFHQLPTSQGFAAHVAPLISFLQHYRGVRPAEVYRFDENIEDFMTSIEAELTQLRQRAEAGPLRDDDFRKALSFGSVFANMNFIFANVLNEAQNGPSDSLYRELLTLCGPNDAFMTFNWDTLLDRALVDSGGWSPNEGYGLNFSAVLDGEWRSAIETGPQFPTAWKLLKLHGSTNWLVPYVGLEPRTLEYQSSIVPDSRAIFLFWQSKMPYLTHHGRWRGGYPATCYCYYPPNIPSNLFAEQQVAAPEGHVFVSATLKLFSPFTEPSDAGIPSSPLLITPVRQKRYETYKSTIGALWDQAVELLEKVDRIVIVGYSFPATDSRTRDLIRGVLSVRAGDIELEIVAPGVGEIVARIGEDAVSKAKNITPHDKTFEDYMELLSQEMPRMMRAAAEADADVRKWLELVYAMNVRPDELQ